MKEMNDEEDIVDFSLPVHTSLMEKQVLFGIGEKAFYAILMVTIILAAMVSVYCIGLGVIALIVCRILCKKEPFLLDFLFENLGQQDIYEG